MSDRKSEAFRFKFKKLLAYAIWILVAILLFSTVKNINRVISIRKQVEEKRRKVEKLEADNAKLQVQIAETQGSEYIEKQIRNKLGLTKEGEVMVVLPDEEIVRSFAPPHTVEEESLPVPNWEKWVHLFF